MTKHGEEESFSYDAFLSFRGEDTRYNFIGHLRKELATKGIKTFLDDEKLRIGEDISPALSKAIEDSKVFIIVFSENYANSTWCLGELVKIRDCLKRNNKQLAVPIFYHVNPSDVRHQRNGYEEAMIKHENRFGKDSNKVHAWKSALNELANLKGQHISTGYETNFIEKIVKEVQANIAPKPLHSGEDPVGLEQRLEEVKLLLNMKPKDDTVYMLGIYGLGGIGKTEFAKAVYDKIAHQFDAGSFLASVTEKSNKINGMEDLQKTLLSEMLEEVTTELGSTSRGKYEIKEKLHRKKVLLVLDDVDDKEILENLAGGCDWFGPGSRIIITTRDKDLLIAHRVETYKMIELNDQHSLELFCQKAFKQSHPEIGYEALSSRAVGYAKGFPLALKVIGSDLAIERSLEAWESTLEKYERALDRKIQGVLKVSYDRLGDNEKRVFLDIACFFKGERTEYVKKILEEYDATSTIDVLVNKSLLMVENGFLKMHDLIQDMGRSIVIQEAPNPGKRSRLWLYRDVIEVLNEDSGSDAIEGIMLNPTQQEVVDWSGDAFKKMKWLRILIVRNTYFTTEPKHLPNHLRVLDWEKYPSKSFPAKFHPREIIVFNLSWSNLTLEEPLKKFSSLTKLNLSHNQSIVQMPDVSEVQNLRELRLDYCENLIVVHESVGFLKNLIHLSASKCTQLKSFPRRMFLPSLQVLDLSKCYNLTGFPDITKEMDKPLKIHMSHAYSIIRLPDSIANLTGLVSIDLNKSTNLTYLPFSLFMLPNVEAIQINRCTQLQGFFRALAETHLATNGHSKLKTLELENIGLSDEDFYAIIIFFPKLEDLIASRNNFASLHVCIKESIHLTKLNVSHCKMLRRIPQCINLRFLHVDHCEHLEEISELPSTIQVINAHYCFSLTRETSIMLWSQVAKERSELEMLIPGKEIPEWFDFISDEGYPRFWARGKFPVLAVALVFRKTNDKYDEETFEPDLIINGRRVPFRGFHLYGIAGDHVLIFDLRVLFSSCKEDDLDALLLVGCWNEVQIARKFSFMSSSLTSWGIFVYKGEDGRSRTNMEDVKFMCPDDPNTTIVTPPPPPPPPPPTTDHLAIAMDRISVVSDEIEVILKALDDDIYEEEQKESMLRRVGDLWRELNEMIETYPYYFGSSSLTDSSDQRAVVPEPDDGGEAANYAAMIIPEPGNSNMMRSTTSESNYKDKDHSARGLARRLRLKLENKGANVVQRFQNKFIPPRFHVNIASSSSNSAPQPEGNSQQQRRGLF